MDFIDIGTVIKNRASDNTFIDRKVICQICSVLKDDFYLEKVTMNFDHKENIYSCPQCPQKISGETIEKLIFFNNRDFIYEPDSEKNEATLQVKFGGLGEDDDIPEKEFVSLSE